MPSDVPRLRYVLPRFHHGYTTMMKTLTSSLKYESSDPAKFRLHVLEQGKKHGVASAVEAFGISRRTYFSWQSLFKHAQGRLASLVPNSTRPHHTRRMEVDARLLTLIRSVRETYGSVGKEKLKVLVSAYAQSLGIPGYGSTKIGKIIKRNRYFFAGPKRRKKSRFARLRVRRVGKDVKPGYLEMDSLVVYVGTAKLTFVTLVDVVTKVAYAERVKSQRSEHALSVLLAFTRRYPIKIHTIQTDNGSEFCGAFQRDLETQGITHLFTYPHTPRVNGVVERFNRTIQEEFLERCEAYWYDVLLGDQKLTHYLTWYNETRPHAALKYLSPLKYAEQYM